MKVEVNKRVTIIKPGPPVQTETGGLKEGAPLASMPKWAAIENRSGSLRTDSAQREWSYDYKLRVRHTPSFVENDFDLVQYDNKTLIIRSVSFEDEGARKFVALRCSVHE